MIFDEKRYTKAIEIHKVLDNLNTYEELFQYARKIDKLSYCIHKVNQHIKDFDEDDDLDLKSIKSMLWFIEVSDTFILTPSITISESGKVYLEWDHDSDHSLVLKFKEDYFLEYLIFKNSLHPTKTRMCLSGTIYVLDMIDLIHDLHLKYLFWLED